jgi:hypothetical protein
VRVAWYLTFANEVPLAHILQTPGSMKIHSKQFGRGIWLAAAGVAGGILLRLGWVRLREASGLSLKGRNVLIASGDRSLKIEVSRQFAAEGANLLLCGRSDLELEELGAELEGLGVEATTICCDISDRRQVEKMLAEAEAALGPMDVIVTSTGKLPGEEHLKRRGIRIMDIHHRTQRHLPRRGIRFRSNSA